MLTQVADNGTVDVQSSQQPVLEFEINVRDDDLTMLESEDGQMFVKTPEMPDGVLASVVPTSEGPITELETDVDEQSLSVLEPAEREQEPQVNATTEESDVVIVD